MNRSLLPDGSRQPDAPNLTDALKPAIAPLTPPNLAPDLSIVVPIYNEVESTPRLIEAIAAVMQANRYRYEIICVDDGSTDGSADLLRQIARDRTDLKAVLLRRNYGQTAAMAAGFNTAQGTGDRDARWRLAKRSCRYTSPARKSLMKAMTW